MSQPTRGDVHVNRPLTNVSVAYINSADSYVAGKVFPIVPVSKQADRYFKYDKKAFFRSNAKKRAPGTESAGGGWNLDNTPTYFADVWAFHTDVSDQTRANADEPLNMDNDATEFVTQALLIRREKEFVDAFFKTGVWTGSSTGSDISLTDKWDSAGSDPVNDVMVQKAAIKEKSGQDANVLCVTYKAHIALKSNASILDRIKHTQVGSVTADILARLFEVDKYVVASAVEDEAGEGLANSMDYILGDDGALLCYAAPAPSLMKPSGGYIFTWTGLFGAGAFGNRISRFRMEHLKSDRIEIEAAYDMKLVAADVGAFFSDVLA